MRESYRSRRRSMLFSWLGVVVMLTSALSWLPAAAQDATPAADPASEQTTEQVQTSEREQPNVTTQRETLDDDVEDETATDEENQSLTTVDLPIEIASVSIDCGAADTSLAGSFAVSNPRDDVSVELQLVAGDAVLRSVNVPLNAAQASYSFGFTLEPADATIGGSVVVTAREEGTDGAQVTSSAVAISQTAEGGTVCGTVDVSTTTPAPSHSLTDIESPTPTEPAEGVLTDIEPPDPTETADATPTGTPSPSPTPGAPPTEQIVAALVRILAEVLSSTPTEPTPTEPPSRDTDTGAFGTVVNTNGANLRCRTAPEDGATITLIPFGTRVETRGGASDGWVPVTCAGQAGWVSAAYFQIEGDESPSPAPAPDGESRSGMVSGTGGAGLRCRTAPVSGGTIVVLPEGARVETRGATTDGWAPVRCGGQNGWVSVAYVLFNAGGGSGELWIDIDLSDQYMRVYRGDTVIMETYVSTGRPRFDTPPGTFYINRKLPSQTMSGVLGGESYHVPNVPWVMYFTNRGHAIHGAYWHNNFGQVMSHGCVNLPVSTAEWLYSVTPIGTRVRIHV